jgi:hypothetical protein
MIDDLLLARLRDPVTATAPLPRTLSPDAPCDPGWLVGLNFIGGSMVASAGCARCGFIGPQAHGITDDAHAVLDRALALFTDAALDGGCGGGPD